MPSNKDLVLLTEHYPYGNSEQFLETEAPYLASSFRKVTIVPNSIEGSRRLTPDQIKIDHSLAHQSINCQNAYDMFRLIRHGVTSISSIAFYRELLSRPRSIIDLKALKQVISDLVIAKSIHTWLLSYIKICNTDIDNTIFYTYWFGPMTFGLAMAKDKYPNMKIISRAHGYDLYEEVRKTHYIPFRQINLKEVTGIFPVSNYGTGYIKNRYKIFGNKVRTSKLGVNNPGFDTPPSQDNIFRIVSCSNLVPVKRIDLLMSGICKLADQRPDLHIEWSHLGDGPLRNQLESEAQKLFGSSIKYHFYGELPLYGVIEYYRSHYIDVFMNVSESEGIPVSIMEAQSCSIPVIATAVGGVPEIVNNENGILLNANPDLAEIAYALEKFVPGGNDINDILAKRECSKLNWSLKYNASENYRKFCNNLIDL